MSSIEEQVCFKILKRSEPFNYEWNMTKTNSDSDYNRKMLDFEIENLGKEKEDN